MRVIFMYDFTAPLFWFKFVFLAEILIAEVLIAYRMKRKKYFYIRAVSALVCLAAFTLALPVPFYNAMYLSLLFILIFMATLIALKFCLNEPLGNVIYCGFFSYNQQHISYQLYNIICILFGYDANNNIYGGQFSDMNGGLQILLFIVPHVIVYLGSWALLTYRAYKNNNEEFALKNFKVLILAVSIVFVNVILNAFVVYDLPADTPDIVNFIIFFYNTSACILALIMFVSIVGQEQMKYELGVIENLWHKNEQIYELSKVNVDFINMKCHDLRHRIRNARKKEFIDENELKEIESAINIYDGILNTGNEVLDVILSEESIFCNKNDIKLLCNIDGKQVHFMRSADLYSIFQNAIHNAVDAVMRISETEKRIIRLIVKRVGDMVSVRAENYISGDCDIKFTNGLPVTDSANKEIHGFGMRSMLMSVEKYGGCMCAEVRDGIFYLDIMLPIADKTQNTAVVI